MGVLVVFESMYGNTDAIATAITDGIAPSGMSVRARPISGVSPAEAAEADLLVIGGPTHVHGMSRETTRQSAANDPANAYPRPTVSPGLREWIETLPEGDGRFVAAFDTRVDKPLPLTGSAARGIGRRLRRRGFRLVARPESFLVTPKNQLVGGEIERARRWGKEVAWNATLWARAAAP